MNEDRFWDKVSDLETSCWEWIGSRSKQGYGWFSWKGRAHPAHRVSWELHNGPIPKGKLVLHHCDNKGCVRPEHLYVGTHADNTRDAVVRHRMEYGEHRWNHKLRDVDIEAIRALARAGFPSERIGPFFGVSGRRIRSILKGEAWKHVA